MNLTECFLQNVHFDQICEGFPWVNVSLGECLPWEDMHPFGKVPLMRSFCLGECFPWGNVSLGGRVPWEKISVWRMIPSGGWPTQESPPLSENRL